MRKAEQLKLVLCAFILKKVITEKYSFIQHYVV